jgi:hypothetical protein
VGNGVGDGVGTGVGDRVGTGVGNGVASLQRSGTPLFGSVRVIVANLGTAVPPPKRSYLTLEAVAAGSLIRKSNRRSPPSVKVRKNAVVVVVSRLKFVRGARMAVLVEFVYSASRTLAISPLVTVTSHSPPNGTLLPPSAPLVQQPDMSLSVMAARTPTTRRKHSISFPGQDKNEGDLKVSVSSLFTPAAESERQRRKLLLQ